MPPVPLPPFRSLIKVQPYKHEGKESFIAADPQEGLFEHQVILPPLAFIVGAMLDGRREIADVQAEIEKQMKGVKISEDEIQGAINELDTHYLLESDRLIARRQEIVDEYLNGPTRPSRFVTGKGDEIRKELNELFTPPAGAGLGEPGKRSGEPLAGIMAPHIDYGRGGNCYTYAYREVAERSDADLYIILGVAHLSPGNPFVVTSKNYDTPLGLAETDGDVIESLRKKIGPGIHEFEWLHRAEHSVEFQTSFLRHALPEAKFTIIPILCSTFEPHCKDKDPSTVARISDFLAALKESVKGRRVCVVAGVDFAHVGPVFGDEVELNQETVQWMVEADGKSLEACGEGSAGKFWGSVMKDGNKRHVCGLSATYSALKLLEPVAGKILKYGFAPDPQGGLVSFASMSFSAKG